MMDAIAESIRIIGEIEPTLRDIPIYLVDVAEFDLRDKALDCLGFTGPLLDIELAHQLSQRGRWRGPGFAAALYVDRIGNRFADLLGVVLHELAHWMTFADRVSRFDGDLPTLSRLASQAIEEIYRLEATNPTHQPEWYGHELPFIRAACHLAHRARQVCDVKPWHLRFSGPYYSGLYEERWLDLLGDELQDRSGEPIKHILRSRPPKPFKGLFEALTSAD
jgi:hypothetical protein